MQGQEKIQNWMKYSPILELYKKVQGTEIDLEPDMQFLSDVHLGRYREYILKELGLPENIWDFLNKVGLPDRFTTWRSPDEERQSKADEGYFGIVFSLRCLRVEKIKGQRFLVIGEDWNLGRSSMISNKIWSWWKTEDCSYIVVEIKTGKVWQWVHFDFDNKDFLTYINSSLEQYLLSMAYWKAFYPVFAQKVKEFIEKNPEKTELDYIFKYRKILYAPFWGQIKELDAEAMRKRQSFWKFMSDISLY